jgi:hypothetical protein
MTARAFVAFAAAIAVALVAAYAALGGGRYEPSEVANPCELRLSLKDANLDAAGQELVLGLLAGAACDLGATREELALALVSEEARTRLVERYDIEDGIVADLLRETARALDELDAR